MVEKYDSVRIGNKRKRASPKSKKTVTVEYAESTFETKGCKHSFHLDCANNILLNQPSDTYFECPVCKAIQGVKMGNQPESGEMKITKEVPLFEINNSRRNTNWDLINKNHFNL